MLPTLRFAAIVLVALSLIPAGAHVLEIAHKLPMSAEEYRVVQTIYRGWALAGIPIAGSLVATFALGVALRGRHAPAGPAFAAFVAMALAQVVFWTFTFPVNLATSDWTSLPEGWETLRAQWEWSHVAGAALTFAAFLALVIEAVRRPRTDR